MNTQVHKEDHVGYIGLQKFWMLLYFGHQKLRMYLTLDNCLFEIKNVQNFWKLMYSIFQSTNGDGKIQFLKVNTMVTVLIQNFINPT